jgi:YegS/Rv2252/BmrU family lipid kinase
VYHLGVPTRTLVVLNPASLGGATEGRFPVIEKKLRAALGPIEIERTRGPRDAERIAREAVRAGVERILVAGGDGTMSEVVTGLLAAGLGSYAQIAPLALGTGGDLLRSFGAARQVDAAIERIALGKTRCVDAGRVCFRDAQGREQTSYFLNVASLGVSGLVTKLVNETPKVLGGRLSFLLATLRALARYQPLGVVLEVDGKPFFEGPLTLATAANGRFFGGGMEVAPRARPDDGLLDVVVVSGLTTLELVRRLPRLYRGTHLEIPGVSFATCRRLDAAPLPLAAGQGNVFTEVDGEPLGVLPARYEVLPGAVTLLGVDP